MRTPDILELLDRDDVQGVALQDDQGSVSYAELGPAVRRLAGALRRQGVSPGDRVAVMLPNCAAAVEMYLACAWLGAIWVGLNPAAPQTERERQCALVRPTLIVTADGSTQRFPVGRDVELGFLSAESEPFDAATPDPKVPCAIGFSSGTTGTPKALVHSRAAVSLAAAVLAGVQLRPDDRIGIILPMNIHNLMVVGALPALFAGATCVPVQRMNAAGVARACSELGLSRLNALVPTTIYDLVHDDTIHPDALSTLRVAGTGAAGLSEDLRSAFEEKFGVRLVGSYGMTEAPGAVAVEEPSVPHVEGGSGTPLPHVCVDARDEFGRPLPARTEGELVVSAAQTGRWAGRYAPPVGAWTEAGLQLRAATKTQLRTGDRGWIDSDGTVHVTGRQADVIIRGGTNINTAELESVLGQLAGIRDVAVIGEADDRLGQRIVAFVEPAPDSVLDPETLRQRAFGTLAHGKVPDEFVVAQLPRNAMGKVARGKLATLR